VRARPEIGSVPRLEVHLRQNVKANASAYLRAAQAYMLISMPTGTSTIFGVFQAILALLARPGECRPPYKLLRKEKFASEIFGRKPVSFYAAMQQEFTYLCDPMSNQRRINRFRIMDITPARIRFGIGAAGFHVNSL
jgi:hypothetical protein